MPNFVKSSVVILIVMTISKAFAVDNCAFHGHGSVVSVVGSGICSSIDAVSQCSDGSYYYAGTANGVADSYDAAMTALGCGSSNASSTQPSAAGRIASGTSSQTSNANFTSSIANGVNGGLNLFAPAMTQTQTEQKTSDNNRSEKSVKQSTIVPQSQAGQHITDNQPRSVAQPVKPKIFTPPLAPEPLIPAELLQPLKPTAIATPSNQTAPEIPNPAVNTNNSHPILLITIAVLCLCLAGIICFGRKRFSAEKT
jgi:hypothetical protein